ncbi:biotin-dependent carboxyltransferase family protein [Rhodococcus rhodnii]|uniref:Urea amidolyase n=2 Tax=Rhodococcus rhodnii TaxID=38312 RepID=R7WP82_9NOCA|nr:biotin-dependent carboxyltransferase family protein [Rhodococcus rhodnii]EOM77127.1 urea amidolyase [Rhodococcus rhodnii LMG 5362]TXG92121.1 biotin-dependent carboxyltransferase family protein [Rhodococcus rhodnii]
MTATIEILATGPQALVQDRGRRGLASSGVGGSGAADRRSHALANRLVGNTEDAATIEVLLGGLAFEARGDLEIAVTGADADVVVVHDRRSIVMGPATRHRVPAGAVVRLGDSRTGLRCYVAIRGGIDVPAVLGSRSTDTLAGVGPAPLAPGDVIAIGTATEPAPGADTAPVAPMPSGTVTLRVVRGPRDDWLADPNGLVETTWTVSDRTSRVGARLTAADGPGVRHVDTERQLPSEGVALGAVQIPPGGEPVVFLADHPVTGGYPVAGVLDDRDVDIAAQLRPGTTVRLAWAR